MEENNLVPFVSQWMTVQPSLFDFLHTTGDMPLTAAPDASHPTRHLP